MWLVLDDRSWVNMIHSEAWEVCVHWSLSVLSPMSCLEYAQLSTGDTRTGSEMWSKLNCSRCLSWGYPIWAHSQPTLAHEWAQPRQAKACSHLANHSSQESNKHLLLNATEVFWFVTFYYCGNRQHGPGCAQSRPVHVWVHEVYPCDLKPSRVKTSPILPHFHYGSKYYSLPLITTS